MNLVSQFNFLGLILSADPKWKNHIDHISINISKVIGIMYQLKSYNILLTLYNSLIVPHLNYCILTWGSKILNDHKIHIMQKKALRIITDSDYIAHSEPICKELRLLKVTDMFQLTIRKFYFKLMNNLLPSYFNSMKPKLPELCNVYSIRKPTFHLPVIRHGFSKQLINNKLLELLNTE